VFVAAGDGEGECLGVVCVVVGGEGGGGFEVCSALAGFGVAGSAGACELGVGAGWEVGFDGCEWCVGYVGEGDGEGAVVGDVCLSFDA